MRFNILSEAMQIIQKNKKLFVLSSIIDVGFILAFLASFYYVMKNVFEILQRLLQITNALQTLSPELAENAEAYKALIGNLEFLSLYAELKGWLLILFVSIFLIWIVEGLSFSLTAKIIDKKIKFWNYYGKFILFSAFFYALSVGSFWLTIFLSMANARIAIPIFTQNLINVIFLILLSIICYFWFISLAEIRNKKIADAFINTFKTGIIRIKKVIFAYLSTLSGLAVGTLVIFFLVNLNFWLVNQFLEGGKILSLISLLAMVIFFVLIVAAIGIILTTIKLLFFYLMKENQ